MKLSEAILKGSKGTDQCFGQLACSGPASTEFYSFFGSYVRYTCALGSAFVAVAGSWEEANELYQKCGNAAVERVLMDRFPILNRQVLLPYPLHGPGVMNLKKAIIYLNDHARWKRERIAEWVQMIEALEEEGVPEPTQSAQSGSKRVSL